MLLNTRVDKSEAACSFFIKEAVSAALGEPAAWWRITELFEWLLE